MKILSNSSIKKLDAYTIEHEPITSIDLMERVAKRVTSTISNRWNATVPITVFAGPGNNGGDALAVARMLFQKGYKVETYLFNIKGTLSHECQLNKELLEAVDGALLTEVNMQFVPPVLTKDHLIIDGLFGTGLNKQLTGGFAAVVKYINSAPATVLSIDIPSGLSGEDSLINAKSHVVRADFTFSLQLPKLSFFFAENEDVIGEWQLLDIGISREALEQADTNYVLMEEEDVRIAIKPRSKFAHKGNFGHALLIAGSRGMAGSSILAARACLRSGVGKLTVYAPICNNDILQVTVPEAIVEQDVDENCFSWSTDTDGYQAVGIGPGLGMSEETEDALLKQLSSCQAPVVIDADALNILAKHRDALKNLPPNSILTPHPKELERIIGKCQSSYERLLKACELALASHTYIILKGAYTVTITPKGKCFFNPTGNAGMATAGSGDVLTGILLALLAQGYTSEDAGKIGVYVHGLAGDFAQEKLGMISLTAGDIIDFLPEAWKHVNNQ